ncbi:MAG: hypothetical protein AAF577_16265 [Pseudomonadota bacterium]
MFSKIALTALIIAVVFFLGRLSGMARERVASRTGGLKGRLRRWGRGGRGGPPGAAVEDLVECPFCQSYVPATERCRCRDTTGRN